MSPAMLALALALAGPAKHDPVLTPGAVCSEADPDFSRFAYSGHVAICRRHLLARVKAAVGRLYHLPRSGWPRVRWDHLIPICAGGSNAAENIWPEPLVDARRKDVLEDQLCAGLRAGRISQAEALVEFRAWPERGLVQ